MDDLVVTHDFGKATDVVVGGCSAGGLAAYLHADEWAAVVPRAKVAALSDSGFFIDADCTMGQCTGPDSARAVSSQRVGTTVPGHYHDGLVWLFYAMNSSAGLNAACVAAHTATGDPWKCQFAEHSSRYLHTPTFALQSEYDSWQVANILGSTDAATINAFGANLTKRLFTNLLWAPQHGAFLDSCSHHCGGWLPTTINGDTQATAFSKFWDAIGVDDGSSHVWVQGQVYPCPACCKA